MIHVPSTCHTEGTWPSKYSMNESTKERANELGLTPSPCKRESRALCTPQAASGELLCSSHTPGAAGVPSLWEGELGFSFKYHFFVLQMWNLCLEIPRRKIMAFYFIGSLKYVLFQKVESINITGNVGMDARNSSASCLPGPGYGCRSCRLWVEKYCPWTLVGNFKPLENMTPLVESCQETSRQHLNFSIDPSFVVWPGALPLRTFNIFLFLQRLVGLISGGSWNFLKLSSREMDCRIKKANGKDISSLGFNPSSNELEVDYVHLSFRREYIKHPWLAKQVFLWSQSKGWWMNCGYFFFFEEG